LSGKYRRNLVPQSARAGGVRRYFTEKNWLLLERLDNIAKEKSSSLPQIALAWLLTNPLITSPIIGANTPEQLHESLGAITISLTPGEKELLDKTTNWDTKEE
jgi:aryl-alcohol dehydrogenase-like predicted oxidoreductase